MTDAPIVVATRCDEKTLRVVCPHCGRPHTHSSEGRVYQHRLAHCADADLPEQTRGPHRLALSYHIANLAETSMTEHEMNDLFDEMDAIADELRESPLSVPEDLQIAFRRLQKARQPELSREQWLDLFTLWCAHDEERQRSEAAETRKRMIATVEKAAREAPPGAPFRCPCGELIYGYNPEVERMHAPHVFITGLDRLTR